MTSREDDACQAPGTTQLPMRQRSPVAHVVPHAPQFIGSFIVRAQVSPHIVALSAHTHAEVTHSPAPQSMPHAPQFVRDVLVSTQRSPHIEVSGGHTHAEASQIAPRVQATPQLPQLSPLMVRSTQEPAHSVVGAGQSARHAPAAHT
jgi:hypothetical protein